MDTKSSSITTQPDLPLISVIMPCYNAAAYLKHAVASVFSQSFKNVELIVIDDGSTDKSLQLLNTLEKTHPRLCILQQDNMGPYPARNNGLKHAKGEYIAFLDADDYWAEDCLEKLYTGLVSSAADLSYCGWQNIIEAGDNGAPYVPTAYEKEDIVKHFLQGCPWPIHAALVKKSIVSKVEGFSTRRFSSMDYDFWLRITTVTQKIALVPEVLAFYRWHDKGQISAIKWRQVLDARLVRKDFISSNQELTAYLSKDTLNNLLNAPLTRQAYDAFWKRDLVSAQKLFRTILKENSWNRSDLKYIILSLLPFTLFKWLVGHR
ncbi:MAG: glycosyltransferase family 2 protein [Candidatus Reddybacter sp.]